MRRTHHRKLPGTFDCILLYHRSHKLFFGFKGFLGIKRKLINSGGERRILRKDFEVSGRERERERDRERERERER